MGNIEYREYSRKSKFRVADFDRSYTSLKDYQEDRGIRLPKVDGNWNILFVDLRFKDLQALLGMDRYSFHDITVFARPEVLRDTSLSKPEKDKKNSYEIFMHDVVSTIPKVIDDKVVRELYTRCRDDESKLENALEEIRRHPSPRITIEILDTIIAPVISVWASDVAASLLVYYNQTIPRKGHPLARYRMKSPLALVNTHVELLGAEVSFYSIRKFFAVLFKAKVAYLKNEPLRDTSSLQKLIVESVDIHTIMYCYLLFREARPKAYYAVVHDIIERQKGELTGEESLLHACILNK